MNAAAYVRYSSDNQREESIDAQIRAIKEYAAREGHVVVKIYSDEARSATTDNRPRFRQMIEDAELGIFECVLVHKLDRFARDRYDSAFYKRRLKICGVRLISVLENLSDSPESIILESVLEGMAEYYSKNLAREVMKGLLETAYQCKHTGGIPPLGYDVADDKSYVINPFEAEAVRMIFNMYLGGSGYSAIIDALGAAGHKGKRGAPIGKNSIHDILCNEKYTGTYIFNRSAAKVAGKRNNHRAKKEEEIIRIPGGMPVIISMEDWEKVRDRMEKNKRRTASYKAKRLYMLSGLARCGECGGAMNGNSSMAGHQKEVYAYYECAAKKRKRTCSMAAVNRDVLERAVIEELYSSLFSPAVIGKTTDQIYNHLQGRRVEIPAHLKAMKNQFAEVTKEIDHIVKAVGKGLFHESMVSRMDELEASKATLSVRIKEAEYQNSSHTFTRDQIFTYLSRYAGIKDMPPQEQKAAIETFVRRVTVYRDYVDVDVTLFPPDKPEDEAGTSSSDFGYGGGARGIRTPDLNVANVAR